MEKPAGVNREPAPEAPPDARWELVQRVAASSGFRKTQRLRELLLFLSERSLRDPGQVVHEQEIGTAVFGKPASFDTSQDTLVRVQASQLRKRLQQYFASEGKGEAIVIEIPRGTYMPVFRPREEGAAADAGDVPLVEQAPRWRLTMAASLSVLLAAGCAWLLSENRALRRHPELDRNARPAVHGLWRQMFGNRRTTTIVLADANLTMFQDLIGRPISLLEYQRQQFEVLAEAHLRDPVSLDLGKRLMKRELTTMVDVGLAQRLSLLFATHGLPAEIVLARNAGPRHFKGHNAILSGSRRSNPWVELFEERLNFRSRFSEEPREASFENLAPLPGEARTYVAAWDRLGYCRVAFLPNLDGSGSVLLLSGTDMASTDAGVSFVTDERRVRELRAALGVQGEGPSPYFEALLRAQLVISASPSFERIAHRVIQP